MAKRKKQTHPQLEQTEQRKQTIITCLKQGNLKKGFNLLDGLKMRLANNPDLLEQTLTNIALATTDEGTELAQRKAAFAEILKVRPNILNDYGVILAEFGQYKAAIEEYEQVLQIKPDELETLCNYGWALKNLGQYEAAFDKYEKALKIAPTHSDILSNYAVTLLYAGQYEAATEKFERVKAVSPNNPSTLWLEAMFLQQKGNYKQAIATLEKINPTELERYNANILYLSLGRLHYLNKSEAEGKRYFDLAIQYSTDKDAERLTVAQNIFADNPYSEDGVAILQEIAESSPIYAQAFKLMSLNLSSKAYYELFNPPQERATVHDTEMLNRAFYHKIANEISILKGIAQRIAYNTQAQNGVMAEIIENIEELPNEIKRRREAGQTEARALPDQAYDQLLETISQTAQDISDFVNNELAVIESKMRRVMRQLSTDAPGYTQFNQLLTQLEFTQAALNDLKSINEGITIRHNRFQVKELFEKWDENRSLANAIISLDIQNSDSEFNGDAEKIKSALNELVENSLKHNADKSDLVIQITAYDAVNPPAIRNRRLPGNQKYLCIIFSDNGRGIPPDKKDKKDWIFLPLKTTLPSEGSGLGLFIIYRTLQKMRGHIWETGIQGAKFEIFLPYLKEAENE